MKPLRVVWIVGWFVYYSAPIVGALAGDAEVLVVTRGDGRELGARGDLTERKRGMFSGAASFLSVRRSERNPLSLLEAMWLALCVRVWKPDVLHVQEHTDWRLAAVQVFSGVRPVVLTVHDVRWLHGTRIRLNPVQRAIRKWLRRSADRVVVHGRSLERLAKTTGEFQRGAAFEVVPLGALAHSCSVEPLPLEPSVLFFGTMYYHKGLDVLVEAAKLAEGSVPGLRVVVAGQGPEFARCREAAADSTLFEWREGFVADDSLSTLFAECRVVVLPYREASQSGIVPVAFSCGRPVIATRVGSLAEAVHDGVNGLLVTPDDPSELAAAIVRVLTEPRLAEELSRGAIATVTNGSMSRESISRAHMDVYQRALGDSL